MLEAIFGGLERMFPGRHYPSGLLRLAENDDPTPQEIQLKNGAISTTRRRRAEALDTTLQLAFVAGLKVSLVRLAEEPTL